MLKPKLYWTSNGKIFDNYEDALEESKKNPQTLDLVREPKDEMCNRDR
jgi:hypothetical protein